MDRRQRALAARAEARARMSSVAETVLKKITVPSADVTRELAKSGEAIAGSVRDMIGARVAR